MMQADFVHLHLHTEYSLVDGTIRIGQLLESITEKNMPAVAVTDEMNLFASVKFYRRAQEMGIKPIIGIDALVKQGPHNETPSHAVFLCQNQTGYRNLTQLVTKAYQIGQSSGLPMLARDWIATHSDGLIVLSGGLEADFANSLLSGNVKRAEQQIMFWKEMFQDHYYIELQRTGLENEESYAQRIIELAAQLRVPVVASNNVKFLQREDFEAHEARVCIFEGRTLNDPRRSRRHTANQYLKSAEEMLALFKDIPEAIENTIEIVKRCNFCLSFDDNILPKFPVPEGMSIGDYLHLKAGDGLQEKLTYSVHNNSVIDRDEYTARLESELQVIADMGFSSYFLIVADFIQWAKQNGIPVGPGRGSGAGSLVAYALNITDLDPLKYDLIFERFLNPERVSMPDFDIDFCMESRDRVIDYVAQKYGRDRVSQIITYGTMAARAVVRDVGRVLGHPYSSVDKIAKLIPFKPGINITLDDALRQEPELAVLYNADEEVREIIDLAKSLEGLARNAGKHAGGVVIAPSQLTDYTALYCEQGGGSVVTQLDKDDVEIIGLIKFDFLGLRTLTIINRALRIINEQCKLANREEIDIRRIPLDDSATYKLLQRQQTTAVFQLESVGIREIIKRLKPDSFEDIIALVALYRPGPLQSGMVDDFIKRKHGARVNYLHVRLEPILKSTYGVILYQEQVMQIAQALAGYTLGSADLLRRAMGKKKPEEMAMQREVFVNGATERGVEKQIARHIFDLMEKFAGYGFNKSHSAAYALLSYQTAWLKAHFSAAFMASVLSTDMDNTDKIVNLIDECRRIGLEILPPDINQSIYTFAVLDNTRILYGLGAIKGVGQSAIEALIAERESNGIYTDLDGVCKRVNLQKLNKRVLEALIRSGALDRIDNNRASLLNQLDESVKQAEQFHRDKVSGQTDLFVEDTNSPRVSARKGNRIERWTEEQRLNAEKQTLGLYLTGHPFMRYEQELSQILKRRIADYETSTVDSTQFSDTEDTVRIAGLVINIRVQRGQSGTRAFVTLDDRTGRIEAALFGEVYEKYSDMLMKDKIILIEGQLSADDYTGRIRLRAKRVFNIDHAREHFAGCIEIKLSETGANNGLVTALKNILLPFREGQCPVHVKYFNKTAYARLTFDDSWRVIPSEELLTRLRHIDDIETVEVVYQ